MQQIHSNKIQDQETDDRPAIWVERVWNHKGSTSGASSGDFHAYRRMKRAEALKRTEEEEIQAERKEYEEFMNHRQGRVEHFQQIQQKKHEKRLKKKNQALKKRIEKKIETKAKQLNKFQNDGSFLTKVLNTPNNNNNNESQEQQQ